MNIAVVGGGVVGVCTAYALVNAGFKVTLFEKNSDVGLETSFANGAQLSYSYVAPLAEPSAIKDLPTYLVDKQSPLKFSLRFDIKQWQWGLQFIKACTAAKSAQTTKELLALSYFSRDQMNALMTQHVKNPLDSFDFRNNGKLVVYRNPNSFLKAQKQVHLQRTLGADQAIFNAQQCLVAEPALQQIADKIVGGIYTKTEDIADCYLFAKNVYTYLSEAAHDKFSVRFNAHVSKILPMTTGFNVVIDSDTEQEHFDQVVLTAGIESLDLAKSLKFSLPLYPLKGYSLTVDLKPSDRVPEISVTDSAKKIVYARLGNTLRIAAMVDMGDSTKTIPPKRMAQLIEQAQEVFPDLNYQTAIQWTGLRPATAQGKPIIDQSPVKGVWLNVGHGALGFTLAMGSGKLLSEMMYQASLQQADSNNSVRKSQLSIDPTPFSYKNVR